MDELLKVLKGIKEDVDYSSCIDLVDGGVFGSFEIIQTISELEEAFGVSITPDDITSENLNSAGAMWQMIKRLQNV